MMARDRKIHIFKDKNSLSDFAVDLWADISSQAIKEKDCFTVALSGGRTPIDFYQRLSCRKADLPWKKTHIFLADERCVSFENEDSNYRLIKENLLDTVELGKENVHNIPVEKTTPQNAAQKYEKILRAFFGSKDGELPEFDLITLGIGEDGHTASLFPGDPSLQEKKRLVVAVRSDKIKHERVTITIPVINNAENIVFLASGMGKSRIVKEVVGLQNPVLPASQIHPENGRSFILVDKEAGQYLSKADYYKVR